MKLFSRSYLCYELTLINPVENKDDPMFKLVNSYEMVKEININYKEDNKKFLYFNKDKVHKLLYDEEEVIKINNLPNNNLSELFYLDLLILENLDSINYSYSIEIIKDVNNLNKNTNFKLKKIIISKIILALIFNFKGSDEYNEKFSDELNEIENENIDNIKNNLEILKEHDCNYDLNDMKNAKIDSIYKDILICLIKKNKFNDYNSTEEILNQLNVDSINITEEMFKRLSEEINEKKTIF